MEAGGFNAQGSQQQYGPPQGEEEGGMGGMSGKGGCSGGGSSGGAGGAGDAMGSAGFSDEEIQDLNNNGIDDSLESDMNSEGTQEFTDTVNGK